MTWIEWIESDYNTANNICSEFSAGRGNVECADIVIDGVIRWVRYNDGGIFSDVNSNDLIRADYMYYTASYAD